VSVVRTKLLAFTVSGTLAGFAGAVFVHQQQGLTAASYGVIASLQAFNAAVIGGIASVLGALLGVLYFSSLEYVLTAGVFQTFLQNGGTIIIVLAYPGGFVSMLQAARDSVLRIVAQRHQLVVPSLFADYDADALERRLIPLQDPDGQSGLAALEVDERWAMSSSLYSGQTRSAAERFAEAARSEVEREKVPTGRNPLLEGASR
jgi:Flp pilus assembly pilin Flp